MNEYIVLIQDNEKSAAVPESWDRFFQAARASGLFQGGSEIGRREIVGDPQTALSTKHVVGYMRFDAPDKSRLLDLLQLHPVVLAGGSIELCELPRS
ncbi:hypothetical protein Verru16b_03251 [Lacunisphaera limnophila]|uniref:YCII-related domain-containing protein n=1 Tax=Lacunisphaera limnophila TaxID=1838286 RepID=A0A1D8AZ70_9BACT|nr:hypothetical protein [Lacunisphaera limnophila]AOS46154.1 hypothetical protein Verru16b_03251 [Lacunisphaera limnophila]